MPPFIRPLCLSSKSHYRWDLKFLNDIHGVPFLFLMGSHYLLPVWRGTPKLLHAVCKVAVCYVRACAGTELTAKFGLEKHFPNRFLRIQFLGIVFRFLIWQFATGSC
ncbi:hypothetical protein OIU77_027401 [Salix suchowensis]|uniref:Uncharacterized protein n=1 Tax=Salix suchowensis TaxID=1278906 RepID=A0ABQ9BS15_9ROSI|nr:hypothetical protein OIU77_027401 [Salix suchowensis]